MSSSDDIATHSVEGISFGFYTTDEVRKLSVKRISNPISLSRNMTPLEGGLYDPAMGPLGRDDRCVTCNLMDKHCPGHYGHIELPVPLFNPMLFLDLVTLMKLVCFNCHHFRMPSSIVHKFAKVLKLISTGDLEAVLAAAEPLNRKEERPKRGAKKSKAEAEEEARAASAAMDVDEIDENDEPIISADDMLRLRMTSNLNQFRNDIISRFLHEHPTKECATCKAPRLPIGREGHAKIFMKRLGPARMKQIYDRNIRYASVLYADFSAPAKPDDTATLGIPGALKDDPVVEWLFYKTEQGTAAYRKAFEEEERKSAKKTSAAAPPDAKDASLDRSMAAAAGKTTPADQRIMFPNEVQEHLRLLWERENEIIPLIWSSMFKGAAGVKARRSDHSIFFLHAIPVPPNRFRPTGGVGDVVSEHGQNTQFSKILQSSLTYMQIGGDSTYGLKQKSDLWLEMQNALNTVVDNTWSTTRARPGNILPPGVKQIIEKKRGLFRTNMMGKRVDYAARSVISPDPYISTTEIGVPLYFAKSLSYPEPVTDYNVEMLRQMVINGPDVHPGANAIEDEHGNVLMLRRGDENKRRAQAALLQKPSISSTTGSLHGAKKVFRHLVDGDVLIVNRQPTLHKPSMMVHKARVLGKENTIQMHYCNCNTYNADFDGDEMNLHLVQNEMARAEAHVIALNDNQYIVPKDGSPIRGLIQDHILSGVLLTKRDTFLTKDRFQQLVYYSCWDLHPKNPMVSLPPPAILKPVPLWTGKQVITAILENLLYKLDPLNLTAKCTVPEEVWGKGSNEGVLLIRGNQMLTGSLGKNQFGAKPHGLVHSVYELYGPSFSADLLTVLGRLLTHWLQFVGFTCGMDDALLSAPVESQRRRICDQNNKSGMRAAGVFLGLFKADTIDSKDPISDDEVRYIQDKLKQLSESKEEWDKWDKFMIGQASRTTSNIIDSCLPKGQIKPFPGNNLSLMTTTGAKGSRVNFSQISCLLGQQELEGKRVPLMVTGRPLPSFLPFDPSPRAGGYVTDRFLTGVRPQEYFFHCMAGREGLIDTAVKTSRSGYLQRCIIKHLESLIVQYDHTVRDISDGSVLQFRYGEDSIDVMKVAFMNKFNFFTENLTSMLQSYDVAKAQAKLSRIPKKEIRSIHKALKEQKRINADLKARIQTAVQEEGLSVDHVPVLLKESVDIPDPVISTHWPGSTLGCISEKYEAQLEKFIEDNSGLFLSTRHSKHHDDGDKFASSHAVQYSKDTGLPLLDPDVFRNAMYLKYLHSLVEAGEAVGVLAGQSIGEPSTQMTLNTFHLAGKGDVNVTLGIPRLRELIQTAGSIKTPSMTMPLHAHCTEADAERIAQRLYCLNMSEAIERVEVEESLKSNGVEHSRAYDITIEFKPFEGKWDLTWNKLERKTFDFTTSLLKEIAQFFKSNKIYFGRYQGKFNWDSLAAVIGGETDDGLEDEIEVERADDGDKNEEAEERAAVEVDEDEDGPSDDDKSESSDSDKEDDGEEKSESESDDSADTDTEEKKGSSSSDGEASDSESTSSSDEEEAAVLKAKAKKAAERPKPTAAPATKKREIPGASELDELQAVSSFIKAYNFSSAKKRVTISLSVPADRPKLLLVSLIEQSSEKFIIRRVPGIVKAAVLKPDNKTPTLRVQTQGINFAHAHRLGRFIDVDNIKTNDVRAVCETYGIEAARESLRSEISSVFEAYGIGVDPRHLMLIADYMTHTGVIRGMTRGGMACSPSPFLQMTYESSTRFLATAATQGFYDNVLGPSSAIVLGLAPKVGSGLCDIRHNFQFSGDVAETM